VTLVRRRGVLDLVMVRARVTARVRARARARARVRARVRARARSRARARVACSTLAPSTMAVGSSRKIW
jgi:hypothetical protein